MMEIRRVQLNKSEKWNEKKNKKIGMNQIKKVE